MAKNKKAKQLRRAANTRKRTLSSRKRQYPRRSPEYAARAAMMESAALVAGLLFLHSPR